MPLAMLWIVVPCAAPAVVAVTACPNVKDCLVRPGLPVFIDEKRHGYLANAQRRSSVAALTRAVNCSDLLEQYHGDWNMETESIKAALRDMGLALNACHNTVTTDLPGVEPDGKSWRINNSKEIALVRELETTLTSSIDTDREYAGHSTCPSS